MSLFDLQIWNAWLFGLVLASAFAGGYLGPLIYARRVKRRREAEARQAAQEAKNVAWPEGLVAAKKKREAEEDEARNKRVGEIDKTIRALNEAVTMARIERGKLVPYEAGALGIVPVFGGPSAADMRMQRGIDQSAHNEAGAYRDAAQQAFCAGPKRGLFH